MNFNITLDPGFKRFPQMLSDWEQKALQRANPKALRKTLRQLNTRVKHQLVQTFGAPHKIFKPRVQTYLGHNAQTGKLWAGLNRFEMYKLGKAHAVGNGVQVNQLFKHGAFIQTVRKGQPNQKTSVWQRKPHRTPGQVNIDLVRIGLPNMQPLIQSIAYNYGLPCYQNSLQQELTAELSKIRYG